jgi:hypothetical protein
MDLNFILKNYSWIQGLGSVAVVLIAIIGVIITCVAGVVTVSLFLKIAKSEVDESWNALTRLSKGALSSVIIISSAGVVLISMGLIELSESSDEIDQKVNLDTQYSVQIINSNKLSLLKKGFTEVKELESSTVDGIEIEKYVKGQKEKYEVNGSPQQVVQF